VQVDHVHFLIKVPPKVAISFDGCNEREIVTIQRIAKAKLSQALGVFHPLSLRRGLWRFALNSYGKSAIRGFSKFPELKQRPYWGDHFWAEGYCVDTVGLNSEMIQKYVKYQEDK
jgi:REP element-mobilizing transposase RayT